MKLSQFLNSIASSGNVVIALFIMLEIITLHLQDRTEHLTKSEVMSSSRGKEISMGKEGLSYEAGATQKMQPIWSHQLIKCNGYTTIYKNDTTTAISSVAAAQVNIHFRLLRRFAHASGTDNMAFRPVLSSFDSLYNSHVIFHIATSKSISCFQTPHRITKPS